MKYLLLVLTLVAVKINTNAQIYRSDNDDKETHKVVIQNRDDFIELEVLSKDVKMDVSERLTYYWYSSNKIFQTKGGYDGRLLHGPYTSFHPSKNLKEKRQFKKGLKDGEWKSWYENGNIKDIVNWKDGLKDGVYKSFTENGELTVEGEFKNGLLHGMLTSYQAGKILSQREYKNGEEVVEEEEKKDTLEMMLNTDDTLEVRRNFFRFLIKKPSSGND